MSLDTPEGAINELANATQRRIPRRRRVQNRDPGFFYGIAEEVSFRNKCGKNPGFPMGHRPPPLRMRGGAADDGQFGIRVLGCTAPRRGEGFCRGELYGYRTDTVGNHKRGSPH